MLSWKIRVFFKKLFWTEKEKEFYKYFHISAKMQRAVRKEGYLDLDEMLRAYKNRIKERVSYDREMTEAYEKATRGRKPV